MSVVKVAGLVKEGIMAGRGPSTLLVIRSSMFPLWQGFYAVIGTLEVVLGVWGDQRGPGYKTSQKADSQKAGSVPQDVLEEQ